VSTRTTRRRIPQFLPWAAAGIAAVAISSCLALTVWTWMQEDEVKSLRTSLEVQQQEHSTAEARIITLQSTARAQEQRLAVLEAGARSEGSATLDSSAESSDPLQEIEGLQATVAEIQLEVSDIQSMLTSVMNRMDNLAPTAEGLTLTIPPTIHLSVARQQQSHNLSCESSAASMVAQYHGVQLSEEEVIASLPANSNPHLGFRGNVDGPTGGIVDYGVYAEPIMDILNARGLQARTVTDGIEGIRTALARGNPVIAWVTYNCEPSAPTTTAIDGQQVTLVPNQHVVVVTGFNAEGVWANDPWDGQEDFYHAGDFERAMSYFGNMAIEIARP
jgi:uncharacterized protein YvpB/uncharacterized coiled-coil protein SlyX